MGSCSSTGKGQSNPLDSHATAKNKIGMPLVGFGTYQLSVEQAEQSVCEALKAGFRHIDSAQGYNNEEGTGRGIKASGVAREEIFVTTKVMPGYVPWGMQEKKFDEVIEACKKSLADLQLDYCDLYLIHGPFASIRLEQWKALVEIKKLGLAKHIGVSNYNTARFKEIADAGLPLPEVNEVEFHPLCQQKELTKFMKENGVLPVAYSSLATASTWRTAEGQGGDKTAHLKEGCYKVQKEIADRLKVSEARLLLRWGLQRDYAVLTKSCNPDRIRENLDLFGNFRIGDDDVKKLDDLDKNEAVAWAANGVNPMALDVPLAA